MLIGVSGAKRSGKDTFGSVLTEDYGYVRVSFAGPLKRMLGALYEDMGMTKDEISQRLEGALKEAPDPRFLDVSPRKLMVTIGTEWGREQVDDEIWVNAAREKILSMRANGQKNIVITDVRFPNEVAMIRELGGKLVCVRRPDVEPDMRLVARLWRWILGRSLHKSELLWTRTHMFDKVIFNDKSEKAFRSAAAGLIETMQIMARIDGGRR